MYGCGPHGPSPLLERGKTAADTAVPDTEAGNRLAAAHGQAISGRRRHKRVELKLQLGRRPPTLVGEHILQSRRRLTLPRFLSSCDWSLTVSLA